MNARRLAFGLFTLAMVAVLIGLGLWQLQRRTEKHALIAALDKRLAVAPVAGTFRPKTIDLGQSVPAGSTVGAIVSQSRESDVAAVHGGVQVPALAEDGDPVAPGQPIALLHPEPTHA